jgi:hypothetical protein
VAFGLRQQGIIYSFVCVVALGERNNAHEKMNHHSAEG